VTAVVLGERQDLHVAWVFPGQGSQAVGMGRDLHDAFPAAREVFARADDALSFPLSTLCFEGPEDTLRQTVNAQPAILTASIAALVAAQQEAGLGGERPAFVAGHSLGEYSALVAANVMSFEDGVRLVRERGRLMQEAGENQPGTMAAIIGLEEPDVEEVCREAGADICNVNSSSQIVIGGTHNAVARAMDLASARGAQKVVPLNVSGAFHSSLMQPAIEGMRRALDRVALSDPRIPLIANCTARPLLTTGDVRDELISQVARAVQWRRSVEYRVDSGVQKFIVIGPGKVLTGLIKRIARAPELVNIGDAEAVRGAAVHA
jgi:[acyl-carrier-protein] S-malonyltransferase